MIVIDPTEARRGSKLPRSVIQSAIQIPGLEALTGADMLVSPLSKPKLPEVLTEAVPHRRALGVHAKAGVLVQRKHGLDLVSSIPDLCNIQKKMMDWCDSIGPWLLVTGTFEERRNGTLYVNQQMTDSNYTYKQIVAALDFWQLRGGHVTVLYSNEKLAAWIARWHESTLHKLNSQPERLVISRPPAQALRYEDAWWTPLTAIRGLGPVGAEAIAGHLPEGYQNLAGALHYLTTESLWKAHGLPKGIGPKTLEAVRQWLGLGEGEFVVTLDGSSEGLKGRINKLHEALMFGGS